MAELSKIKQGDIVLGKPLPHSVYDKKGTLLLKAGFTIKMQDHLDYLIESGLYMGIDKSVPERATQQRMALETQNAFETLDRLKIQLKNVFSCCTSGKAHENFARSIMDIAFNMQEACAHDTDAALANLHLDYETPYIIAHSLQAAMICELVGKKLGVQDETRLVTISAALTQGLGLLDLQDTLDRQLSPLTQEQKARINAHPLDGAALLESLGVTDATWLDAVRQHHERLDGSGYPHKLTGGSITVPARLLAVADTYSAMVRERPYRKAMLSKEVMRSLMVEQGRKVDQRLIEMMFKVIGFFPPGAIVKLSNGEVGVVKKRQENSACPIVFAFVKPDGLPRLAPVQRDTGNTGLSVTGIVNFSNYRGSMAMIRGLWINN